MGESGAILVSTTLDGSNYQSWSRNMRRALGSKNKYKFVNGSIPVPNHLDPDFDVWERCNNMVVSWITRCLSAQIAQCVVYIDNAQDLWENLKGRFSKGDHFRISDLLQELQSIKQGERNISSYFTDLKTVWEDLESLRPLPSCTCLIKCKCDAMKISEYVVCFLKGLNDDFNVTKAQILLMEPLPTINIVFHLGNTHGRNNNNYQDRGRGFGRGYGAGRNNNTKVCTFCGKERHTADVCYYKHGFPPNFGMQRLKSDGSSTHNTSSTNIVSVGNYDEVQTETLSQPTLNFSPAQYAKLVSLMNNSVQSNSTQLPLTHKINQLSIMPLDENDANNDTG
ncbi:PREDICTED: uncharacterized protein LOC109326775 [Lupinus angustifolius]|uniref:uncharacterized protein LOC109326775 n=1 Tax=Lupinus angustifolius TaxID=3871 RepID=UPI00092E5809|nr:PREDICTED: uncharacterized protein LOC109326775 [Lupinus angustifolius]